MDEVQKLPALLNDVHDALAGRVIGREMYALTIAELRSRPPVDDLLRFEGLPLVRSERAAPVHIDLLEACAGTYLAQEVRAEALVRSLESFTRFLEAAALANGHVANVSGLARDSAVARPTVQGYFQVLTDTLIGAWLPAWRGRATVKEIQHPKFYLFDCGIVRALSQRLREPLDGSERVTCSKR